MRNAVTWTLLVLACSGAARAQDAVEVTVEGLNVRAGPATGYSAVSQASRGEVYPALGQSGDWVRIQFGDTAGWAHSSYLRASSAQVLVVTADPLNVRSGPSSRYRDLGDLPGGTRVAVREAQGDWRRIDFAGRTAWVHSAYLGARASMPYPAAITTPSTPSTTPAARPTSRAGFISLDASGAGYVCYSRPERRWGTPRFIYGIERIARRWATERTAARLQIGDISAMNGGQISGHASHRRGVDGDFRPLRSDTRETPLTRFDAPYSRALTQRMIDLFVAELPVTHVFFNDTRTRHTSTWPNHDNHFHVRIRR